MAPGHRQRKMLFWLGMYTGSGKGTVLARIQTVHMPAEHPRVCFSTSLSLGFLFEKSNDDENLT